MDLSSIIASAASNTGLSPSLISSVIKAESNGNPVAVSSTGAQGLMQLEPSTAQQLGVTDPFDPVQNVNGGSSYLASLINQFGSVPTALAAYNWGPGNVANNPNSSQWPESVQNYVDTILNNSGTADLTQSTLSFPSFNESVGGDSSDSMGSGAETVGIILALVVVGYLVIRN